LDRRLDFLQEHGNLSGRPVSAALGDGIFELRANQARMLFYFGTKHDIIFVHCLIKKTRRVPREDIELAKKNRAKISMHELKTNAIAN
jgi:phage-related protein